MSKNEKFNALVSKEKTTTIERNKERIKNRAFLRESQSIAMKVLDKLDELGWTQKRLAKELKVSPQQITKIVSGKENLTIETQVKLQEVLDIPILASYHEKREKAYSAAKLPDSGRISASVAYCRVEKGRMWEHMVLARASSFGVVEGAKVSFPTKFSIKVPRLKVTHNPNEPVFSTLNESE